MERRNQILGLILVIQIALGVVVFWPRTVASGTTGPLLADFKAADVTALTVSDENGKHLALAKKDENWVLPEAGDYPADSQKVSPLLDKIAGIQTNRLITQTEASHKRLKVAEDDYNSLLELTMQDGNVRKLFVGSSSGAGATNVRLEGQSEVYLTNELTSFDANAQASSWIDTLYYTIPSTATTALTLENPNGTFEFAKEGDKWTMKGLAEDETFAEGQFTAFLNQATSMRMTAPVGKEEQASFGLDAPQAVITLKTDQKTYTVRIGAKDETDNTYIASYSDSLYFVRIAQFTGDNFVTKTRTDFLELPPTPTPEAGSQ